jgi:hypothetical protein
MSLSALSRHAEAVGSWERAIAYDRDGRAWMRINRACDLALAGRIEDAAQAVDDAVRQWPDLKPIELRAAAGALAVCARAVPHAGRRYQEYSQGAIGLLQRAIEGGYRNVAELDSDAQFEVIRALPEFHELTATLRSTAAVKGQRPQGAGHPGAALNLDPSDRLP